MDFCLDTTLSINKRQESMHVDKNVSINDIPIHYSMLFHHVDKETTSIVNASKS